MLGYIQFTFLNDIPSDRRQQVDAPVKAGQYFRRGDIIYLDNDRLWNRAGSGDLALVQGTSTAPARELYWATQDSDSPRASSSNLVTGYSVRELGRVTTTAFLPETNFTANGLVMVGADGKIVPHTTGKTSIGRFVRKYNVWNPQYPHGGVMSSTPKQTGEFQDVIEIETAYEDRLVTA